MADKNSDSNDFLDEVVNDPELDGETDSGMNLEEILKENTEDTFSTLTSKKPKANETRSKESTLNLTSDELTHMHPLDVIEKQEREISELDYPSLESKFVLSNFQLRDHKKISNIVYSKLELINERLFQNQEDRSYGAMGNPRSLTISAGRYIVVGTHYCVALVFDYNQGNMRRFGTNKEYEFGSITAMDIDSERECLICGYEKGQLVLWDLNSGSSIKTIQGVHDTLILSVKFWKDGKSNFISSDTAGHVFMLTINKVLFAYTVDKNVLLDGDAGPVCSISVVRKDTVRNSALKGWVLAALCSPQVVLIVTLEPIVGIVFKAERPSNVKAGLIPSCTWGIGATPDAPNNTDPLLAMVWGSKLQLFQVNNIHVENGKGFRLVGYYQNDSENQTELVYAGFISKNLIAVIDAEKEVKILYTGYLRPHDSDAKRLESERRPVLDAQLVDPSLLFQVVKDEQGKGRSFFQNTVYTTDTTHRIFLLARKSLYIGRLSTWEERIKSLVSKGEWLAALAVCLEIYKGSNKMFADIPNDEAECNKVMKPFFRELISDYIAHVGSLNSFKTKGNLITNPDEIWEMVILTTIDFLVSSENFHFLFIEIRNQFAKYGQIENFISNLEPFILHNKITYIPNEPFREIVAYFSKKGKSTVLEHLIINLNIKSIDVGLTTALCMEHELLTGLLYICTHTEDPDYLTPLAKMFGIYQSRVREGSVDAIYAGYKCLWYIRLVFQGQKFPRGLIERKEWRVALQNIVIWIFTEEILRGLFNIDAPIFFDLLSLLFKGELAKMLEGQHRELEERENTEKIYIMSQVKHNQDERYIKIIEKDNAKALSKIHLQMLEALYSCCVNISSLKFNLALFMGEIIMEKKYLLRPEINKKLIEVLLQNEGPKTGDKKSMAIVNEDSDERQAMLEIRSHMLLELIKNCEKSLKKEEFDAISSLAALSPYLEVKRYLIELKGEYKKCFEFYINQPSSHKKKNLFPWLRGVLPTLPKSDFEMLRDSVLNYLKELVTMDSEQTREILALMDKSLEASAIKYLESIPTLQLSYLEKILQKRGPGTQIDDELLVLHIQLLCKLDPKRVILELKNFDYPLDPCLKLCRSFNVNDACAFLLERSGSIKEALELYLEMFKKSFETKIKKMEQSEKFDEKELKSRLDSALHICISNNKYDDPDSEALWFFLLDKLLDFYKEYISPRLENTQYKDLTEAGSKYIMMVFDKMTLNVALDSIIERIEKHYGEVFLGVLKKSLLDMLSNYHYESAIMKNARILDMEDTTELLVAANIRSMKGTYGERMGPDAASVGQLVIFECGHTYPSSYVAPSPDIKWDSIECPFCSKAEDTKILKFCWNFKPGTSASGAKSLKNTQVDAKPEKVAKDLTMSRPNSSPVLQFKFSRGDVKNQMLRKLKLYDQKKDDENYHV